MKYNNVMILVGGLILPLLRRSCFRFTVLPNIKKCKPKSRAKFYTEDLNKNNEIKNEPYAAPAFIRKATNV